jgi:hypothetical protein
VDVQREAVRAMANLSAEYAHTAAIVASGALMPLVATLSSPDFLCQRYAAMGIGNLATNMANQEKILQEGALAPLVVRWSSIPSTRAHTHTHTHTLVRAGACVVHIHARTHTHTHARTHANTGERGTRKAFQELASVRARTLTTWAC